MTRFILLIALSFTMLSCGSKAMNSNQGNSTDEDKTETNTEDVRSDVENCFKQWNADNPRRPDIDDREDVTAEPGPAAQRAYKEYIKNNFGKEHARTAIVRMYSTSPVFFDGSTINDADDNTMKIETDDYIVYSLWRGPAVAKSKKTGHWFVVWDEDYNYNTKYITDEGNNEIKMEYVDVSDIDNNTNVIYYNLDTHKYYFVKEQRSENEFF